MRPILKSSRCRPWPNWSRRRKRSVTGDAELASTSLINNRGHPMSAQDNKPTYDALPVPNEAIENGGIEVLRAALVDDELYVEARRAFKDPAQWGELLADIARRVALLYS